MEPLGDFDASSPCRRCKLLACRVAASPNDFVGESELLRSCAHSVRLKCFAARNEALRATRYQNKRCGVIRRLMLDDCPIFVFSVLWYNYFGIRWNNYNSLEFAFSSGFLTRYFSACKTGCRIGRLLQVRLRGKCQRRFDRLSCLRVMRRACSSMC